MPRKNNKQPTESNPRGAGAPVLYKERAQILVTVERELKNKYALLKGEKGELNAHYQAALEDYLHRPDIAAKLEGKLNG